MSVNGRSPSSNGARATREGDNVAVVHAQLRDLILTGALRAGQVVSQTDLSERLDAGRTPLREALRMLQHEGLIVASPNRRAVIAPLSAQDAEELYILRISLECVAVRLTVPTLTPADLAELDGLLAQIDHLADADEWALASVPHREFHGRLVAGAGQRVLEEALRLADHAERYRRAFGATAPGGHARRRVEHRAIVDAAARGDGETAARELAQHYLHTVRLVFAADDPGRSLDRLQATIEAVGKA
jgi:DNA-binding GntR family transcriptional regulator